MIANDADHKRAFLLTHQINRLNTANIIVANHNAQEFPNLYYQPKQAQFRGEQDSRFLFDRVLADVPCSSDAAIRKIPAKWASWTPRESQTLHPLQVRIVSRGFEMLKVGGKLSYSTCSLNPIENESVVAALLHKFKGKIRLLDVKLPGFQFTPGLNKWRFLNLKTKAQVEEIIDKKAKDPHNKDSFFNEYHKFEDVPLEAVKAGTKTNIIRETMFTSHYPQDILNELHKCVRVMPHHQNTSGFFITIIEKVAELDEEAS